MPIIKRSLFEFLEELELNNNREWWAENKHRYESDVREPCFDLIRALEAPMASITGSFTPKAKKVGGSLMRVFRDTRFSKDKTPYKTNVGIHIRHNRGKDVHAPGFYIHLDCRECFLGVGMWKPDGPSIIKIRAAIDAHPKQYKAAISAIENAGYSRMNESLKRPPRGYDKDHPLIDELKLKSHICSAPLDFDDIVSDDFVKTITTTFTTAAPLAKFLCDALDVAF